MSSLISGIRLYNYNGGYTSPNQPTANGNVPTSVPGTAFTAGVPTNDTNLLNQNFGITPTGQLTDVSAPQTNVSYESAVTPYQDYQAYINSLGSQNLQTLIAQGNFTIMDGSLGINVQTNGTNITGVSLDPYGYNFATGNDFGASGNVIDEAEVTTRASGLIDNDVTTFADFPQQDPVFLTSPTAQPTGIQAATDTTTPPTPAVAPVTTASQQVDSAASNQATTNTNAATNPLQQNLLKLQPIAVQTPVIGFDSPLSPDQSRNVATVNAGLNVQYSDSFNQNISALREQAAQQPVPPNAANAVLQARDGNMPINPFLQGPHVNVASQSVSTTNTMNQFNAAADTTEKKSSSGTYIPFRMSSGGGSNTGSSSQQQPRRRGNAVNFVA